MVSDCNRAAVEALADWPGLIGGVMAVSGPAGCGKSRLAQIWAERVGALAVHGAEAALIDPLELEGRPVLLDRAMDADDETLFHLINLAQAQGGALLMVSRPAPRPGRSPCPTCARVWTPPSAWRWTPRTTPSWPPCSRPASPSAASAPPATSSPTCCVASAARPPPPRPSSRPWTPCIAP